MKLPQTRSVGIIVQNAGNETLVYDTATDKAFCLNETSAIVYNACDGATTFAELKSKYQFTDDLIFLALDELKKENLLAPNAFFASPFAGMNRREVIRRVGFASLVALPVIASLVAPTAANAQSIACSNASCSCTITVADYNNGVRNCSSPTCTAGCTCRTNSVSLDPGGTTYTASGNCQV